MRGNCEEISAEFPVLEHEAVLETCAPLGGRCTALPGDERRKDRQDAKPGGGKGAGWLPAAPVRPEWFLWAGAGWGRDSERICDRIWP